MERNLVSFLSVLVSLLLATTAQVRGQPKRDSDMKYGVGCGLRQYNFTAKLSDENGKTCRGKISARACFGSCESLEYGTFEFPFIISVNPTCNYETFVEVSAQLTECDDGASQSIKIYKYFQASACQCKEPQPTEERQKSLPMKRNEDTNEVEYYIHHNLVQYEEDESTKYD